MGQPPAAGPPGPGSWVDVASRLIIQLGFPVVVAGVLLWFLLTRFQDNMLSITARMEGNATMASNLIAVTQAETAELQRQTSELHQQTDALKELVTIARTRRITPQDPPPAPAE